MAIALGVCKYQSFLLYIWVKPTCCINLKTFALTSNKKYHAFISYSHKDKYYATVIQHSIETLGLPFYKKWRHDVSIFRDVRKIPLSGSLSTEIVTGLQNSNYLIVIASKNSAQSTWVKEEIETWHRLNQDGEGYIKNFNFVLVDDVVEWDYPRNDFDRLKTTALPQLSRRIFKELPIWANLQQYCKGGKVQTANSNYEWEVAKIKALLLGRKPDEIIDESSKAKRSFRVVAGVVIAALAVLSVVAFSLRGEAVRQREIAEANAEEANKQKDSALNNLRRFKAEEFERNLKNGSAYFDAEVYCLALDCFSLAKATAGDSHFNQSIPLATVHYIDSVSTICKTKGQCK
jgi:TIR domain